MKKEIKIGIFTVLMILGGWFGIRFLSGIDLLSRNNDYYVIYDKSNGVQKASAVVVNGVKIGNVTDVRLSEDRRKVVIKLTVPSKYQIPTDSEAKAFSSSLMSSKEVGITLGTSDDYFNSGDTISATYERDIMDIASNELEFLKERIDVVTTDLSTTLSNLNTLLEGNTQNITNTMKNLEVLTAQTAQLVKHNDEQFNQIIEGFSLMSQALGNSAPQIDSIISNLSSLTAELDRANVGKTISESIEEMNTLIATLNDENGSINRLMTDEALYENLASASGNMDSLFIDLKENPWRYVNFSLIGRNEYKLREKMEKKEAKELRKATK